MRVNDFYDNIHKMHINNINESECFFATDLLK